MFQRIASPLARGLVGSLIAASALSWGQAAQAAPMSINIVDVAGNLALTQKAFEQFEKTHPGLVHFTYSTSPAPQLLPRIRAMEHAGRSDINMVLTGTDDLAFGIQQGLWQQLLPGYAGQLPGIPRDYSPGAARMQDLAKGYGVEVVYSPAGPLLEYNPQTVKHPPRTPQQLLSWCQAHPGKFIYARPNNSGPGRAWLMALPYLLHDSNPRDPVHGWTKTWAYLKQLNACIAYYPSGTGDVMKELGQQTRWMTPTITGWDINPRKLGIVPKDFQVQKLDHMVWLNDAQYMVIPKGQSPAQVAMLLRVMRYMMKPEQQAMTYDDGYFYPGPAIAGVSLGMAPASSQQVIREYGRKDYDAWIAKYPNKTPLNASAMVKAFEMWNQQIGALKH